MLDWKEKWGLGDIVCVDMIGDVLAGRKQDGIDKKTSQVFSGWYGGRRIIILYQYYHYYYCFCIKSNQLSEAMN